MALPDMSHFPDTIQYSEKYEDECYEYRHVILTKKEYLQVAQLTGGKRLLQEPEWRRIGVQQSHGWMHYEIHFPEPHVLLFRRPLGTNRLQGWARTQRARDRSTTRGALNSVSKDFGSGGRLKSYGGRV